jgi:hypothetical protein
MERTIEVKQIEEVKTMILDLDIPAEQLLAALKGAEYSLLLRLAAEKKELKNYV